MDTRRCAVSVGLALLALTTLGLGCQRQAEAPQPKAVGAAPQGVQSASATHTRVSGPFQHENLAVFLVHGKSTLDGTAFLTLDEALARKVLVVHETENVNELTVDNLSERESIFIQGGEMVSGGKQDRLLGTDLVVAPKARGMKIPSFCVEHARWSRRGTQSASEFTTNYNYVRRLTRDNDEAVGNVPASQEKVWAKIRQLQQAETGNVPGMALNALSPSSLDLTHEDPKLRAAAQKYTDKLKGLIEGKADVIGFVCAINGEVDGADVYGSAALFRKLWPKLLEATALDAIAKLQKGKQLDAPSAEKAERWLTAQREGKALKRSATERISGNMVLRVRETDSDVLLETVDEGVAAPAIIHRAYEKK